MEFIYINEKNLKIIISADEIKEHLLDVNKLDYSEIRTKRFFWEIMNKAYEITGFDSANSKLYVKIFPNNDGGCEMFVTKEHVHKSECKENKGFIFTTSDTDGLFMLCNRMKSSGFFGKSQLYCDDENKFYLLCCTENNLPSYISSKRIFSDDFLFANEYGNVFGLTDITKAYLEEHMTLICDDLAVERITK